MSRLRLSWLIACVLLALARPAEAQVGSTLDDVTAAEIALAAEGYNPGPANGVWGETSARALMAYQRDWQLPVTGQLTPDLVERLKRTHPATRSQWYPIQNSNCTVWNDSPQPQESVTWTGGCADGRIEGEGRLVWRSVRGGVPFEQSHEGTFVNGREHGYGVAAYADGGRYEGEFREGDRHGQGTRYFPDGSRYDGQWRDNRADGSGTLYSADGRVYSGNWQDGCFAGGAQAAVERNPFECGF